MGPKFLESFKLHSVGDSAETFRRAWEDNHTTMTNALVKAALTKALQEIANVDVA